MLCDVGRAFRACGGASGPGRRWIVCALLSFFWSASPAAAAVYRYTFASNGPGAVAGSIELIVSGLTITGVANGSGLLAGASLTGFNLSGQTYYGTAPRLLSTSPSAQYFFSSTTEEALGLKAGGSLIAIRSSSIMVATDSGSTFIGYPLAEGGIGRAIESQSLVPAPAPLPGAGWMSWLLVGGFAAWRRRTHASAATVGALVNAMRRKIGGLRLDRPGNGGGKSAPAPAQTA